VVSGWITEVGSMEKLKDNKNQKKAFFHSEGVTYFDKKTERTIFFVLTILMLIWGIFTKLGMP
jgi:hypothetical protein